MWQGSNGGWGRAPGGYLQRPGGAWGGTGRYNGGGAYLGGGAGANRLANGRPYVPWVGSTPGRYPTPRFNGGCNPRPFGRR